MTRKLTHKASAFPNIATLIAVLTLLIALPALAKNPLFLPAVPYGSGGSSGSSITTADFNGDGRADLGVTNANSNTVGVLLGKGDGTFQTAITYDSGGDFPSWVAEGDVNGDGKPDLVVANYNSTTLGVLLGNGDGTFQPVVTYGSGGYLSWSAALADVNGDGKLDLLVANQCASGTNCVNGTVGVLLGNGDGTFQAAATYDSGGNQALSVAVSDVNADGKPDLLVANWGSGTVSVLLGNGDGTFQAAVIYGSGGSGDASVAVADVNGDGKLDLLVTNDSDSSGTTGVGVLLGNGNGTFQSAVTYGSGGENSSTSIAVADVNGDNKLDLLVASVCASGSDCTKGVVGLLLGNGDGTFQPAAVYSSGGFAARWVAVGDLNADGRPDLLVANCGGASCAGGGVVGVLLNSVGEIPTTTLLTSSLNPSVFGQAVTFTAKVKSASGKPTGTVNFFDGSTALGSAVLVNKIASLAVSVLAAGSHSVTAVYQGSTKFNSSASAPLNQIVHTGMTTTSLSSSQNPAALNQIVAYTATVASQYGGAATGTVTFKDSGATVATFPLVGNQAVYTTMYTNFKNVGAHVITAAYSGDANNASSQAALTEYVGSFPVASKTVLTTSGTPSHAGQPVTFTAIVTPGNPRYGAIPDGELVTFYDGATAIGTSATASSKATFTTTVLTAKTHHIKATYTGDAIFKPSSGRVTQVVEP